MTTESTLYIVRHGQTMFNKAERVQGWADTPLTPLGRKDISSLGRGLNEIAFNHAYSSDSGRAQETTQLILAGRENPAITHTVDPRIREWSFGSYEGELESVWFERMGEKFGIDSSESIESQPLSYKKIAETIMLMDEQGWAESYEKIEKRILTSMTSIAETTKENVLVVSHGLTIAHFLTMVSGEDIFPTLKNGSVSKVRYTKGKFDVMSVNDMSYMDRGR